MENNPTPEIPQTTPVVPITPVTPVNPPITQPQPVVENIIPEPPMKNPTKIIVIAIILVLIVGTLTFLLYKYINSTKPKSGIVKTSYVKDGTTFTNYQFDDQERKTLETSCFTSVVPSSAKINYAAGGDCTLQAVMPDTTMPFLNVIAIDENDNQDIKEVVYAHDAEYRQLSESENGVYESKISEEINFGGLRAYILNYYDGTVNKSSYYIDIPEASGYKVNGLSVRGLFINGFANDPTIDVFSKYFKEFVENFKYK